MQLPAKKDCAPPYIMFYNELSAYMHLQFLGYCWKLYLTTIVLIMIFLYCKLRKESIIQTICGQTLRRSRTHTRYIYVGIVTTHTV